MQKLVKEYLDELNRRHKKSRKVGIAIMLLAVIVVGSVMGILTQYGAAMTGKAQCGQKEHAHGKACYEETQICGMNEEEGHTHTQECRPEKELTCGLEESAGHTHTQECRPEKELICGLEESAESESKEEGTEAAITEGHTHTQECYAASEEFICGLEESEGHTHEEACYTVSEEFICGLAEGEGHTHEDVCYKKELICEEEEHEHTDACYLDEDADVEDPASWDAAYAGAQWSGNWGKDLADAARMQIGYKESDDNYTTTAEGVRKGYTRYGHFWGSLYADWDAAFINFCMHYAGIKESGLFPETAETAKWQEEFININPEHASYLTGPDGYAPAEGDLVFFRKEKEETQAQMGIVSSYDQNGTIVSAIEGNSENEVRENQYDAADPQIVSYLKISELEAAYKATGEEEETKADAQTTPESVTASEPQTVKRKVTKDADGVLNGDDAYVDWIEITDMADGAAPFDDAEGAGNDANAENRIVRTFDTVTYNFLANMKPWNNKDTYREARVKMEFVLPAAKEEAEFDTAAMAWMDDTEGYRPIVTEEMRVIDGEETFCQVLTCYKHLIPSENNLSVIPGQFGENVTIQVKAATNGRVIAPIFSAAMEHGAWDGACENEEHQIDGQPAVEKKTIKPDPVTVTAAPKYNIQIKGDGSYKDAFDFSTGNDLALNKDKGTVEGRLLKAGITIQLYNDNESKGLKGIDLPKGPITFELELSSKYSVNVPQDGYQEGQQLDVTGDYTPLIWSYGENLWIEDGYETSDERLISEHIFCAPFAPYSNHAGNEINSCWESGNWRAVQNGNTVRITIENYEINMDHMPTKDGDYTDDRYGAHIGSFSAGAFAILQPYNKIGSTSQGPDYDVVKTYGQGSFATTITAKNLQTQTISGTQVEEGKDGFHQTVTNDDELTRTLELTLGGSLQNRVRYAGNNNSLGSGVQDNRDGRDYAAIGSEVWLVGGLSYNSNREERNSIYWATNLSKFYGSAIELEDEKRFELTGGASLDGKSEPEELSDNIVVYYATKPDGTDWASDEELLHTYEEDLEFYASPSEIPKGKLCVGILYCFRGPGPVVAADPYYYVYHKAKVRDDISLTGDTYMLASTSRVWTKEMFEQNRLELTDIPDWADKSTSSGEKFRKLPGNHLKSANIEGSTFYRKETYKEDGSGIWGTHNSDWYHWGDTLLVIGFKSGITKNLLQKDEDGTDKKTFSLDANQRVVDFKLQPHTQHDLEGSFDRTVTITVVDTLPKYLSYKPGSAYFGGEYSQSSKYGGTKGTITGGTLTEPEVTNCEDGTQKLKWTIPDVVVGEPMDAIYYSADIGTKGNPETDVPSGTTNLENQAYITSPYDNREPCLENGNFAKEGISVVRGSASSFGKYTQQKVADEDGEIDYVVYYNNNSSNATHMAMMDTMPADKINGSKFTGTYRFAEWKLDTTKCDPEEIKIYYTTDVQYQDKTTSVVTEEEMASWTPAPIGSDGVIELPATTEDEKHPVAWAVIGNLAGGQSVYIHLKIELDPGVSELNKEENNYFVNYLSSGDTTTVTETPTVRRTLEGLTWMDYNRDGIQNEEEEDRISGVKVELLQLSEGKNPENESSYQNVCYPGTEIPVILETGQQVSIRAEGETGITWYGTAQAPKEGEEAPKGAKGRYKFLDLPSGTFAVRFTDGSGESKITELHATEWNLGANDSADSDGVPSYTKDGQLEKTAILEIDMPLAKDMSVALHESRFHDSGFYPDTEFKIQKTNEAGTKNLSGAIFLVKDSKGNCLSFTVDGEDGQATGSYTVYREEIEEKRRGKYYIAYAENPYYVLGFRKNADGEVPVLQTRDGNDGQLFEVTDMGGGFKAFQNMASLGKWLDLDGGRLENGAKVHQWSNNTPNDNQMWSVPKTEDQNGSCYIKPKNAADGGYCLDIDGGVGEVNRKIHLWEWNKTQAQKWLLIPAGSSKESQTDLSVDASGSLTIKDLIPGDYTISELKSPDGYALLAQPVEITIDKYGNVTMKTANDLAGTQEGSNQLVIRNTEIYELPSAGGRGIYWYSIGGTLFMLAGALILYRNKRRETLGI